MEASSDGINYVLVVNDDLSGYRFLRPTSEADSETTKNVLVAWFTAFGVSHIYISNQGGHFKNLLIEEIR